jgi:hypothetical protein
MAAFLLRIQKHRRSIAFLFGVLAAFFTQRGLHINVAPTFAEASEAAESVFNPERLYLLETEKEDVNRPVFAGSAGSYSEASYYSQTSYYEQGYYQSYYQSSYYSQAYYQSYYQSYYQGTYQTTFSTNVSASGNFTVTNNISKSSGSFVIDHPLDPKNKLLYHSFVESPDAKNIYDGEAVLDEEGEVVVTLPGYFDALNNSVRYQVKPIGAPMPDLHVSEEVVGGVFRISGGVPKGKVSWQISAIRKDPYILANPIVTEVPKTKDTIVPRGEFLYPKGFEDALYKGPDTFTQFINFLWRLFHKS